MKIERTSGTHDTNGNADVIDASGNALFTHRGNSRLVKVRERSAVIIRGLVSGDITAEGQSVALAWGNQRLVSASGSASIGVCGSPNEVVVQDDATISNLTLKTSPS